MGKKSTLVTKIAGLTDGGENTAAEVRALLTEDLNNGFNDPVRDNLTLQTYITKVDLPPGTSGNLFCEVTFQQVDGRIFLEGYFYNQTSSALNETDIFTFKDSNFSPLNRVDPTSGFPFAYNGEGMDTSGQKVRFVIVPSLGGGAPTLFKIRGQMTFTKTYFKIDYPQQQ